jgi:hypothetical protein
MRRAVRVACFLYLMAAAGLLCGQTAVGTGNGGNIPVNAPVAKSGTFTSDAVMHGAGTVAAGNAITVTLKGLEHDWSGDLIATLSYLDAQGNVAASANLFYRIGQGSGRMAGSWAAFGTPTLTGDNYTFNSDAAANIWNAAATLGYADFIPGQQTDTVNNGQYFSTDSGGAKNNLSYAFAGLDIAAGTWRLTITDASDHSSEGGFVSNTGSLAGWEVDVRTANSIAVNPSSGSGSTQTFTFSFTSSDQAQEHFFFNSSLTGNGACYLIYDRPSTNLYIVRDDGTAVSESVTPGGLGIVSSSQCSVAASSASVLSSGDTVTITVTIQFAPSFFGAKNIYTNISDTSYVEGTWQQIGTWTVLSSNTPISRQPL